MDGNTRFEFKAQWISQIILLDLISEAERVECQSRSKSFPLQILGQPADKGRKMSFVVLRGENGFKGRSSVGFDGTGCSREKPKWIISREAFLLGVWVAEFPFNHQTSDSAHLYNHHQQFLQLQLVRNSHLEGKENKFKLQNQQSAE